MVYACTLPPWLPKKTLQDMVDIFGKELVTMLIKLKETASEQKRRKSLDTISTSPTSVNEASHHSLRQLIRMARLRRIGRESVIP
jgi:hypothetical protein